MKLLIAVIALTFCAAVQGVTYKYGDCILVDIEGSVTFTGQEEGKTQGASVTAKLEEVNETAISGSCSNGTSASMRVQLNDAVAWTLVFSVDKDGLVNMDQLVSFKPSDLFNTSSFPSDQVSLSDTENTELSKVNETFLCEQELKIPFTPTKSQNYTFTVSQTVQSIKVQAFGLENGTYSGPVVDCAAGNTTNVTTVAPTTEPTTEPAPPVTQPVPTVKPVDPVEFLVKDSKDVVCFRMNAGLQFAVEYETVNKTKVFSKVFTVDDKAAVTGTCQNDTATMEIAGGDYTLTFTEKQDGKTASSTITLNVTLDAENFPDAADVNKSVVFERTTQTFQQTSVTTFYVCNVLEELTFNNNGRTTLYADNVKLQAFGLNNGAYSGDGEECSLDPTPAPSTPAPSPSDNTYSVEGDGVTCIVLQGDISFKNITYMKKDNSTAVAKTINIPAYNKSSKAVQVSGSCALNGNNNTQQIVITFNTNWTLAMTFARGGSQTSGMLGASQDEYAVRDIEFTYDLRSEFFPNASNPNAVKTSSRMNITDDLWKGQVGGGSYKCDAEITETLDDGVEIDTQNLQYKAFNQDNSTTFNSDNVSECPADDESNSIVPIAVGAALAGLVVIVLIAYLIGRRRSRRQGYESV